MSSETTTIAAVEQVLRARWDEWRAAYELGSVSVLDAIRHQHQDAGFAFPGGVRLTRAQHIALELGVRQLEQLELTEFDHRVYGDTAIVWASHTLRARLDVDRFEPDVVAAAAVGDLRYAFTSVWHRFGDDWRVVSQDAQLVPPAEL